MIPERPASTSEVHDPQTLAGAIEIEVANRQQHLRLCEAALHRLVRYVLQAEGIERACLSLAIVEDSTMQQLHERFLNVHSPTDVLSFPLGDDGGPLEGEVVVNAQQAARVAHELGCSAEGELFLYVVHGTLHLCGYDDRHRIDADVMRQRQSALLAEWENRSDSEPNKRPRDEGAAAPWSGEE
jgi:probable rRNA maturation factor